MSATTSMATFPLGNTGWMPQFNPEQLDQRRQRMAEAEGLAGWYLDRPWCRPGRHHGRASELA